MSAGSGSGSAASGGSAAPKASGVRRESRFKIEGEGPRGGKKEATVEYDRTSGKITVTWLEGTTRVFNVEGLRQTIMTLDIHQKMPEMWFVIADERRSTANCKIDDGRLGVACTVGGAISNGSVPWADLRRALQAAIAEMA